MDIEQCVIQLVVRDTELMVRFAQRLDADEELLWPVADGRGELVYLALQERLEVAPMVCRSALALETLLKEVVVFHSDGKGDNDGLFAHDFDFSLHEMNLRVVAVQRTFQRGSFISPNKTFYQQMNQAPCRPTKLDKRV